MTTTDRETQSGGDREPLAVSLIRVVCYAVLVLCSAYLILALTVFR